MANNTEVTYEIIEHIGELGKRGDWTREVNIVAWNGGVPKVDIREWSPNHKRMARGITLMEAEAEKLAELLSAR
ncbi:MAG: hypothetical protein IKE74_05495 [Mogibacterium sp.]|nr:hypothetical protein [Mogibacterium sp.]